MERLTGRDEKGNLTVEGKEVYAGYLYNAASYLEEYENIGLTPEQIEEMKGPVKKLQKYFGDTITVGQVIDFFVDYYIAQGDQNRVEAAELLTNEEVTRYKELKDKDTAKEPKICKNKRSDVYTCTNCNLVLINKNETGWFCGKHYKFCPDCGQRLKWEE